MKKNTVCVWMFLMMLAVQGSHAALITIEGSGSASGFQNIASGAFDAQPADVPVAGSTDYDFGAGFGFYTNDGRGVYVDFGENWNQVTIEEVWFGLKLNGPDPLGTPASYWSPLSTVASAEAGGVAAPDFFWDWTADTGAKSWQLAWSGTETVKNRYYVQVYDGTQTATNRAQEIVFVGTVPEPSTLVLGLVALASVFLFKRRKS